MEQIRQTFAKILYLSQCLDHACIAGLNRILHRRHSVQLWCRGKSSRTESKRLWEERQALFLAAFNPCFMYKQAQIWDRWQLKTHSIILKQAKNLDCYLLANSHVYMCAACGRRANQTREEPFTLHRICHCFLIHEGPISVNTTRLEVLV